MGEHSHEEEFESVTLDLEADQIEEIKKLAAEYSKELGQEWDMGAVVRLAVGDLLTKLKRMT